MRAELPKLLLVSDVARLMGWPKWKARRWLLCTGAASKRGGRYVCTHRTLIEHFPEVLAALTQDDA